MSNLEEIENELNKIETQITIIETKIAEIKEIIRDFYNHKDNIISALRREIITKGGKQDGKDQIVSKG